MTVHVPLTPETEDSVIEMRLRRQRAKDPINALTPETTDSIDKEPLVKMPKRSTLINAARPESVHEARDAHEVLSARTNFYYLSDVPVRDDADQKACEEQSVVIMNTLGQNVKILPSSSLTLCRTASLDDWQEVCVLHESILNMVTGVSQQHGSHHGFTRDESERIGI